MKPKIDTMDFEQHHKTVKGILNKVKPSHALRKFVVGITQVMVLIGVFAFFSLVLLFLNILSSNTFICILKVSIACCIILYSVIAFCAVWARQRYIRVHKRYQYAVSILGNRYYEFEDTPNFFYFHKILYAEDLYDIYMSICSLKTKDLKAINNGVSVINKLLRRACSQNRDEITQYLINSCYNQDYEQSTYTTTFIKSRRCILEIREILKKSFKSKFAYECISDIIHHNLNRHSATIDDNISVGANEELIYKFFEPHKRRPGLLNLFLYIIPIVLFITPGVIYAAKIRLEQVKEIIVSNIHNTKISDAIIAKMDILETFIADSIEFEQQATIPLKYSINHNGYYKAPYVGNVHSTGTIRYNGQDYNTDGTIMYTYGTDITIISHSTETDDVPDSDRRVEKVKFSKEDLKYPREIEHELTITENRGRYKGYWTIERFRYSFSVNGPELPGNEIITKSMLKAYTDSNKDIDTKELIKNHFFSHIEPINSEDILKSRIAEYQHIKTRNIDLSKEIEKMEDAVRIIK